MNDALYSHMLNECYKRLKELRDHLDYKNPILDERPVPLYEIASEDDYSFSTILEKSREIINWGILNTVADLLKATDYEANQLVINKTTAYVLDIENNKADYLDVSPNNKKLVAAFIISKNDKRILYVFKEFGLSKRFPPEMRTEIMEKNSIDDYRYVSLVDSGAYLEVLNYKEDSNDPSRGTKTMSLRDFFVEFISLDEYDSFRQYLQKLQNIVKEYYGFTVLKTLGPSSKYRFKNTLRSKFRHITTSNINLSSDQFSIVENQLYHDNIFALLLGKDDFAQSYITAEWLYESLQGANNIDLTPVSLGYFKLIEQLLFAYISLHTNERDNAHRKIYNYNTRTQIDLTNSVISDKAEIFTLSAMYNFFGYHKPGTNNYDYRNTDLLCSGITQQTHQMIIDDLQKATDLRNDYVHKENLTSWAEVEEQRVLAHKIMFWILGAYHYSVNDMKSFDIDKNNQSDHQRLYQHINTLSYIDNDETGDYGWIYFDEPNDTTQSTQKSVDLPFIHVYVNDKEAISGFPVADPNVDYSDFYNPVYSGLYIKPLGKDSPICKLMVDNVPCRITESRLQTSRAAIKFDFSDEIVIYENGKYMLEDELL